MNPQPALRLVLGLDGGGSSTDAWLVDEHGIILGRATAGPSNPKAVGPPAAHQAIDSAIAQAFANAHIPRCRVAVACLGLAGFDRPHDHATLSAWNEINGWAELLVPVNDGTLVVTAGTPRGQGVGIIAGTGSIAVARSPGGALTRAGGWGHLIGDEGSAYTLVLNALKLVAHRHDGRLPPAANPDPLTTALTQALDALDPTGIITSIYDPTCTRTRLAALAPVVLEVCKSSPRDADLLLVPAGRDLAQMAAAAARSAGFLSGPLPVAIAGSFLLAAQPVVDSLIRELIRLGYQPQVSPVPEPVKGAVVLALRALANLDSPLP